ncbi:hypothetical protein FACS18948_2600 [Clostridia bacterium]|nr:hypothetical protein FACS18948_2600 [Clostridia bacterium]
MKRYLNFEGLGLNEQTATAMRNARFALCEKLFASQPPPSSGLLDSWPIDTLETIFAQHWNDIPAAPSELTRRLSAKRVIRESLVDDCDCLSPAEHELVERLLVLGGSCPLSSAEEFDAALALRNRLWCDLGGVEGVSTVKLDASLEQPIHDAFSRFDHTLIRSRVFTFDAMIRAMLYAAGFLDDHLPRRKFAEEVLERDPSDPAVDRLARNFVEAAYDCVLYDNCRLLLHEALALPESFVEQLAMRGANIPPMTSERMLGCMNGLLPEERPAMETLRKALQFSLRPGIRLDDAVEDLKLLTKQGVCFEELQQVAKDMLCVVPTPAISFALRSLIAQTPRWL